MADEIYLQQVQFILQNGTSRPDRTGVGTVSVFGLRMEFDLSHLPLLTTKKMAWKTVIHELLFFIQGRTDSTILEKEGVKIWSGNSSQAFLDKRNLKYQPGDIGPMYGFQWRHFNAPYTDAQGDYTSQGVDQLQDLITQVRQDPYSRRMICSAWNPCQIPQMVLPPCHILFQLYVRDQYLDLQLYQRSGDMMLGIPFNIFSYSVLLILLAHHTNKLPGRLIHVIGDAHIYQTHLTGAQEQVSRRNQIPPPGVLKINWKEKLEDYSIQDFELENYHPLPPIKFEMAV